MRYGKKGSARIDCRDGRLQMGSGTTACSEASVGVCLGAPAPLQAAALASRFSEIFIPRKIDFKGWDTAFKKVWLSGALGHRCLEFHQRPAKDGAGSISKVH